MEYTLDLPKSMIDELSRLDNAKQVVVELLANFLSNTRPNSNDAQANQQDYNVWLEKELLESINNPGEPISHDLFMRQLKTEFNL